MEFIEHQVGANTRPGVEVCQCLAKSIRDREKAAKGLINGCKEQICLKFWISRIIPRLKGNTLEFSQLVILLIRSYCLSIFMIKLSGQRLQRNAINALTRQINQFRLDPGTKKGINAGPRFSTSGWCLNDNPLAFLQLSKSLLLVLKKAHQFPPKMSSKI